MRGRPGRRHRTGVPILATLCMVLLAGCGNPVSWVTGADPVDEYCSAIGSHQAQFADMFASSSPDALIANLPMLESIATKAPPDVADDWQSFLTPIQGLDEALRSADVRPADYRNGTPPAGTSMADRKSIAAAASLLATPVATAAASSIDQEVRDVCRLNLGM